MMKFYSQLGQDKFLIESVFKNKKNGIFVDVGSHDGELLSNTLTLEENFNWSGVCVEPNRMSSFLVSKRKKSN